MKRGTKHTVASLSNLRNKIGICLAVKRGDECELSIRETSEYVPYPQDEC